MNARLDQALDRTIAAHAAPQSAEKSAAAREAVALLDAAELVEFERLIAPPAAPVPPPQPEAR